MSIKTRADLYREFAEEQSKNEARTQQQNHAEVQTGPEPVNHPKDSASQASANGRANPADYDDDIDEDSISPFPVDCLPLVLADMTRAVAASALVPIELSASAVLGPVSASAGKGIRVKSGADRYLWGNIFLLSMARSGIGKSLALRLTSSPFVALQKDRLSFWKEITYPELAAELRILNKEIARLEQQIAKDAGDDPKRRQEFKAKLKDKLQRANEVTDQLHVPRLIVEDETEEHLALALQQNKEQLFSLSADAGKVVQNLVGRYSKDQSPDDINLCEVL
jgi:hypothetical protein